MNIHLISDLHIESGYPVWPDVDADVCVLSGDIGVARKGILYREYLTGLKKAFKHVILVLGNHEFYHSSYQDTLDIMQTMTNDCGVHLMDVELGTVNLEIDGVKFWGSTLWTDLNKNDWFACKRVGTNLNDFHVIKDFSVQKYLNIHEKTVERINWDADVVITHHMPILRKHSRFEVDDITYGFNCTTLEQKILDSKIKFWMYGHTHDNVQIDLNGTIVVTNQKGYSGEGMTKLYNPKFIVTV